MIENCTLTRIDRVTGHTGLGDAIRSTGAAVEVRGLADEVQNNQRWELGATIKDASRVLYLPKANLVDAGESAPGLEDNVYFTMDGESGESGQIVFLKDRVLNGISHFEVFTKKV